MTRGLGKGRERVPPQEHVPFGELTKELCLRLRRDTPKSQAGGLDGGDALSLGKGKAP